MQCHVFLNQKQIEKQMKISIQKQNWNSKTNYPQCLLLFEDFRTNGTREFVTGLN